MTATLTISHSHADGTLLHGSSKGDGVWEIARAHGFSYFPSMKAIGIRGSRDQLARRHIIDAAAEALRTAGHEVTVEIDDTPRDRAVALADRADRLEGRREALEAKTAKLAKAADDQWAYSDRLVEGIPFGQPILVGHHSERRHRRTLEKSQNAAFKAVALGRQAAEAGRRADSVGSQADYAATPRATALRIERTEADLRKVQRALDGYSRRSLNGRGQVVYVEEHQAASGGHRERLETQKALLEERLRYDRDQLARAVEEGRHVIWSRETVHVGDMIGGRRVVRVNKATVSVESGYSWTDKVRYTEIRHVRCEHTDGGSDGSA